jgi:hypothetical protein
MDSNALRTRNDVVIEKDNGASLRDSEAGVPSPAGPLCRLFDHSIGTGSPSDTGRSVRTAVTDDDPFHRFTGMSLRCEGAKVSSKELRPVVCGNDH